MLASVAAVTGEEQGTPPPVAPIFGFRAAFLTMGVFGLLAAGAVWALVRERDCQRELELRTRGEGPTPVAVSAHASPCQPAGARILAPDRRGRPRG